MSTCRMARLCSTRSGYRGAQERDPQRLSLLHCDRDLFRHHRWIVRDVQLIAQHELQRVLAGWELELGFGLTLAEVQAVRVVGQGLAEIGWRIDIDQQVMMTGVLKSHSGGRNTHPLEAKAHSYRARDLGTVLRTDDVDLGTLRRRCAIGGQRTVEYDEYEN